MRSLVLPTSWILQHQREEKYMRADERLDVQMITNALLEAAQREALVASRAVRRRRKGETCERVFGTKQLG